MYFLFYSLWSNPHLKINTIIKYLLQNSCINSRTWSIRLRQISEMYGLDDPFHCLTKDPPTKSSFKENVLIKITAFHERELKRAALNNS